MTVSLIAPIVEGHGEVEAVRTLLTRVFLEVLESPIVPAVLQPIRVSKSKVIRDDRELLRAVDLAALKIGKDRAGLILLLLDGDRDPACLLAPRLLTTIRESRSHLDVACVLAVAEYETWFVAAASSLSRFLHPSFESAIPADPEGTGVGKGWIERFFVESKYSETVDQARLTAAFDLRMARERSPSFDKLCRELERRAAPPSGVSSAT
jgi:hypothetical protein